MASATISVGDLTAIIGDNAESGEHRAGYNGLWSLTHKKEATNLFVPIVAGFNLEHIFDGQTMDVMPNKTDIFFEPRKAKMTFKKLSDSSAELHQPPTPTFFLESWTTFTLREPDIIDVTFKFKPHQHAFKREYIGLFWASYMNAPEDKSIYFQSKQGWEQHCTPTHNTLSTVLKSDDKFAMTFAEGHRECLYKNFSPLKFDLPFYYGNYRKMMFMLMFDRTEGIRFCHSPSGGGFNKDAKSSNPAWDFLYVLPKYEVLKEYSFRARMIYRERCPREDLIKAYESWKKEIAR